MDEQVDQLVELAAEAGDPDELRRLAAAGSSDAADVLAELEPWPQRRTGE